MDKEPSIEQVRDAANDFFDALNADSGILTLGQAVNDAAWKLYNTINPNIAKAKHQAAHPHDHQDYCEGCQSTTDMWIEDTTRCDVCREKYPDGY